MSIVRTAYAFSPTTISNCSLWLDAADSSTITGTTTVTAWTDKSGNGNHAAFDTNKPSYTAANRYIETTNNNTHIRLPSAAFTNTTNQTCIIFIIYADKQEGNNNQALFSTLDYGLYQLLRGPSYAPYNIRGNITVDASYTAFKTSLMTTNTVLYSIQYTAGITGAENYSVAPFGNYWHPISQNYQYITSDIYLGGVSNFDNSGDFHANLKINEVIAYNNIVLTTTQRQQVESYLGQKWGLTSSLVAGHPGRTSRIYRSDYLVPNRLKPTPYYTQFSPRQILGCSLWMDGADSSTMTQSSSYISAWTSKGNNALSFTQSTSTKQPLLVSNVYNGNSVVRCINPGDPVVNVNITTVNNAVLQTGASFCIFIVHNPTIANGSPFCFQNGGGNRIACHLTENGNVVFDTPNVRLTYAAPGNYLTSGLKLDVFWSVANAINYRASGTATASASASPSSWTDGTLTFGSFTPTQASYYYQTDIGEIIWYNTAITLAQVQQVESYLAQKWGLTASLPGGHSHLTQPAGAVTTVAKTKFKVTGLPRYVFASTGLAITHQDGRVWKVSSTAIGLNTGTAMSLTIYAGADVFNSAGGRVALFDGGSSANAVRHSGYNMYANTFSANNYDFGWKFVSSGSGYLIYNDYPSYSSWQVSYDSGSDRVLIVAPADGRYGLVWNVTPRVTLAYVYSSY